MPRHYAVRRNPPSDRDTTFKHDCLSFAHTLFSELMGTKKALEAEVQPRPTVRDAMHLTLAGAKLVAGSGGLDHPVEWVRLMETPEVQPRAGDLMFTTGFPIKDNPDAQIRLVRRIW